MINAPTAVNCLFVRIASLSRTNNVMMAIKTIKILVLLSAEFLLVGMVLSGRTKSNVMMVMASTLISVQITAQRLVVAMEFGTNNLRNAMMATMWILIDV